MEIRPIKDNRIKIQIPCPDGRIGCGVCHYVWLEKDCYNQIHDRYYDAYGVEPSNRIIGQIFNMLPSYTKQLGRHWGWDDTEVRDSIAKWMGERIIVTL